MIPKPHPVWSLSKKSQKKALSTVGCSLKINKQKTSNRVLSTLLNKIKVKNKKELKKKILGNKKGNWERRSTGLISNLTKPYSIILLFLPFLHTLKRLKLTVIWSSAAVPSSSHETILYWGLNPWSHANKACASASWALFPVPLIINWFCLILLSITGS